MSKDPERHGLKPDTFSERLYTLYRSSSELGGAWWKLNHANLKREWELDQSQYLEQIELAFNALKADEQEQTQ